MDGRMPVHAIDLEFLHHQIIRVANDHAVRRRIEIDNVTRTRRPAGQSLTLTDREQLYPIMFANAVSIDVVNFAAMKFVCAEMRT